MKFGRIVIVLAAALLFGLMFASQTSAYSYQTGYMVNYGSSHGWSSVPAWNPGTRSQLQYTYNRYQRPEGYGLVPHNRPSPYPPRGFAGTQYCDNTELLGHTSVWRPGVYRSGLDGRTLQRPQYRSRTRNCQPTRPLNQFTYDRYW